MARVRVNEIFHSIQGESTWAGLPCAFVRLTGCNLRCSWCDTEYAFYEGHQMDVAEVAAKVDAFGCRLVEITGGEPLLQAGVHPLIAAFLDRGYQVMVETSGERDISVLDPRVIRIVDLKCPGSGESARNRWANLEQLTPRDELKFVLADRRDYEWARDALHTHRLHRTRQRRPDESRSSAASHPPTSPRGFSPIACRSACNSRCTSTSGRRPPAPSNSLDRCPFSTTLLRRWLLHY